LETHVLSSARPVLLATDSPAMRAARAALAEGFGREPALVRCGASVPVTEPIQRLLKLDAVLMGFGLPSDNLHSPNEHFRLDQLWRGSIAAAAFMQNLAAGGAT
jgi:acetylornithine deacetylase/succinyl-diaminopimelate desuccinylase-like protein